MAEVDVLKAWEQGITHCRKEKWHEGYELLTRVAQQVERRGNLPGVFYSYLGVAMARCEGRRRDGLELCRYGTKLQPNHHENYLNLANVYLMLGRRAAALRAVEQGLELRPGHSRLLDLRQTLGMRQPLVLPFLSRSNPLNSLGGRIRAWVARRRQAWRDRRQDIATFGR